MAQHNWKRIYSPRDIGGCYYLCKTCKMELAGDATDDTFETFDECVPPGDTRPPELITAIATMTVGMATYGAVR